MALPAHYILATTAVGNEKKNASTVKKFRIFKHSDQQLNRQDN